MQEYSSENPTRSTATGCPRGTKIAFGCSLVSVAWGIKANAALDIVGVAAIELERFTVLHFPGWGFGNILLPTELHNTNPKCFVKLSNGSRNFLLRAPD